MEGGVGVAELPPVSEKFSADADPYIAAIQAMIERTQDLLDKVTELKTLIGTLDGKTIEVNVGGNALEQIQVIEDRLDTLDNREITVLVNYKNVGSPENIAAAQQLVKEVLIPAESNLKPVVQPVVEKIISSGDTGALKNQFQNVVTKDTVDVQAQSEGISAATAALETLRRALDDDTTSLAGLKNTLNVAVDAIRQARNATGDLANTEIIAVAQQELLDRAMSGANVTLAQQRSAVAAAGNAERELNLQQAASVAATVAAANAEDKKNSSLVDGTAVLLASIDATLAGARARATLKAANDLLDGSVQEGIPLWRTGTGLFGAWNSNVQLFGGALTQVGIPAILATAGTVHILLDSILEIASTVIPAAIAFGAFGVAAAGPVADLYQHEKDVFTVTQALQQQMYPFTGQLQAMQNAVKPEVYVLFGEALQIVNKNAGEFSQLAVGAGHVLDQLGARFTYAMTSGTGFSTFLKNSVSDLAGWGTLIGNLGGIIGNLLKALPGFGQAFLGVAVNVTHFAEGISGAAVPLEHFLLLGHGLLLWLGLAGTAGTWAITGLLTGVSTIAKTAALNLEELGVGGGIAQRAMLGLSSAAGAAADLPWGWILIAAAGLGVLAYHFLTLQSEATQFADTIQSKLVGGPLNTLAENIHSTFENASRSAAQANNAFAEAKVQVDQLNQSMTQNGTTALQNFSKIQQTSAAYQEAANRAADWNAVVKQAQVDQTTYNNNMKVAVGVFGSAQAALNAFTNAGISSGQFLTTNKQQFAEAIIEAQGYTDALRAASDGTGRFAAAENALSFVNEDNNNKLGQIDKSMTQVTQAQTQLIGTLTGGESAFIAFRQDMITLGADSTATGANMHSLTGAALTMQAQFYSNVNSLQTLINAEEMQGVTTSNLTTEVASGSQSLLAYAGNNVAARAVVISLINDALGPGTVSFKNLNQWVNQNATSQQGFAALVAQTTVAASKLAQTLSGDLNAIMAQSIADAYGGQKAFDQFAQGILNSKTQSTQFITAGQNVILTLFKQSGDSLPKAQQAFMNYAMNGLGLSITQAQNLWNELSGKLVPQLGGVAAVAQSIALPAFVSWANNGLHFSQTKAQDLWSELTSKLGPTLSGSLAQSVLSSQGNFETWAMKSLSLSRSQADLLYQEITGKLIPALHNIPTNVHTNISASATGSGGINATIKGLLNMPGTSGAQLLFGGAAGGGVIPGYEPGVDSVPMLLSKGEGVLIPQAVRMLGGEKGISSINKSAQRMAAGGIVGGFTNPVRPEQFETSESDTFETSAAKYFMQKIVSKFNQQVAAARAAAASSIPLKNVPLNLVPFFTQAMRLTGVPGSWLNDLETIAAYESGLNVNAINLTDSNAAAGDPSRGLMQTIMSTFQAYHQPGTSGNIYDPTANIAAAINYIKARYGSVFNVPGIVSLSHGGGYIGYDSGGYLMPGLTLAYNGTGQPERVSPPGDASVIHNVINMDGKTIYEATLPYAYQKASRNRGNVNANRYWAPGG